MDNISAILKVSWFPILDTAPTYLGRPARVDSIRAQRMQHFGIELRTTILRVPLGHRDKAFQDFRVWQ